MYLDKLNNNWVAYMSSSGFIENIVITNTTKLSGFARLYMLEFLFNEKRYHLYHVLGETIYDLRNIDKSYTQTSFQAVFGINVIRSKDIIAMISDFMDQNYAGIQTSVECNEGLEHAKKDIHKARLRC